MKEAQGAWVNKDPRIPADIYVNEVESRLSAL
jgi:hypothetical protein